MDVDRAEIWKRWAAINRALAGSLDTGEVLQGIVDSTLLLLDANAALILLSDGDRTLSVQAASGVSVSRFEGLSEPMDERIISEVRERLGVNEDQVVIAVPVVCEHSIDGVLIAVRNRRLEADEAPMLEALADQASLALRNARLHELELESLRQRNHQSQMALAESEQKTAEALSSRERWLEAAFDLAPSPILLIEPEGHRILFANRAARAISEDLQHLIDEQTLERIARGESLEGSQIEWQDGGIRRTLLLYAKTFPPLYGHPSVGVVVFHDITPIKRVEEELRRANESKDEFLAMLSHELRTPLTVILGWAGMLEVSSQDESTRKNALKSIVEGVRAQNKLIDDLLDVSRIVKGTLPVDRKDLDLSSTISDTVRSLRPLASDRSVQLQAEIAPGIRISGDAQRCRQMLSNLISNSLKFTPAEGLIHVSLQSESEEAVLRVRDSGQGISAEFLPHVFDRFRQEDSSSTRQHGGLGLGLAIVKTVAEIHGGTVEASSEGHHRGTTMTVRLPALASLEPPEPKAMPDSASRVDRALEGIRILLIEDDSETLDIFRLVLEGAGAEVAGAATADEALNLLSRGHHVIVSDIALPGTDGYGFMLRARQADPNPPPAIAVTAYGGGEARQTALDAGFVDFLLKPIAAGDLIEAVARIHTPRN